jgi:hypothetical protein
MEELSGCILEQQTVAECDLYEPGSDPGCEKLIGDAKRAAMATVPGCTKVCGFLRGDDPALPRFQTDGTKPRKGCSY